jgi:ribonuclease-3
LTTAPVAAGLERGIGHVFEDRSLLEQALRHRSMEGRDNERLEFLGDGLLNALIGIALYRQRPRDDEGALSRLRASLVRESTLAELAREIGLGDYLELGESERKTGGHRRDSILSDALEAILGAVYLDAGFEAAQRVCLGWFRARLAALPDPETLKDPKTRLQEWLQARSRALPVYRVLRETGPAHRRHFEVRCELADAELHTEARGVSRRAAEQQAAEQMLARLTGVAHA